MGESLNPSPLTRLLAVLRPDWSRTVAARRVAAGRLVILAAVAALRPDPAATAPTSSSPRAIWPRDRTTADDMRLETASAATIPDGSQTDVDAVVGATLAGPARRGEVLTDVRVLGPRLAESAAGPTPASFRCTWPTRALLDSSAPATWWTCLPPAPTPSERRRPATGGGHRRRGGPGVREADRRRRARRPRWCWWPCRHTPPTRWPARRSLTAGGDPHAALRSPRRSPALAFAVRERD